MWSKRRFGTLQKIKLLVEIQGAFFISIAIKIQHIVKNVVKIQQN